MTDNSPLLRSSLDFPDPSDSYKRQLNRSMSLRAALLAFPLPQPAESTIRRHSMSQYRPSPLKRYNSNYQKLTHARSLRVRARHSQIHPSPVYAMPTSYEGIEKRFPRTRPMTSSSLHVEPDLSNCSLEAPTAPKIVRSRQTLLRSGTIAGKQRLRKKSRQKPPTEISINVLRNTTSVLNRTMHKARDALGSTKKHVGGVFKRWKVGKENIYDFHKYVYDLHSRDRDEESVDSIPMAQTRRGTWTNLNTIIGLEKMAENNLRVKEDEGLETIQEITEMSDYQRGIEPSHAAVENFLHSLRQEKMEESVINLDTPRKPSHHSITSGDFTPQHFSPTQPLSPNTFMFTPSRPASSHSLAPANSPSGSVTTPSPLKSLPTQTLFPLPSSTTYEGIDPIKPSLSISTHNSLPAEITRSASDILHEMPSATGETQRVLSLMSNDMSRYSQDTDENEKSIPVLDAWKWSPPTPTNKGKSVRERVRELDLAIDGARKMERHDWRESKMFSWWKG
jgi:hypothetical protein